MIGEEVRSGGFDTADRTHSTASLGDSMNVRSEHCTEHDMSDMPRRVLIAAMAFRDANRCH